MIVFTAGVNIAGFTGQVRQRPLIVLALADIVLQLAVIAVGAIVVFHPDLLTSNVDLFTTPSAGHIFEALAVATLAFAGIEAASDLAPDLEWEPRDLRRVVSSTAVILLPLIYAGMAAVALMAVPVVPGPDGPHTALGERFIEEPVLGVVMSYDPAWLSTVLQVAVVAIAPAVLAWAASTSMLGLSRHVYVLATNRQVPSWLGKLGQRSTPYVAISAAAVIAFAIAVPGDIRLLAGIYAFGATLAIAIAHLSVVRLRWTDPDRERPFRIPFDVAVRGRKLPLPAIVGAVLMVLLWIAVLAFHGERALGGGRLDAVRPGRLRRLPAVRREDVADEARLGAGGGAAQGGARGRVRRHPRAGLRDQARRRHRGHRGPPGRRRRPAGRASARSSR